MLDHIHLLDKRLEAMALALERQGIGGPFNHLPDLDACEIHSTADDGEPAPGVASPGLARVSRDLRPGSPDQTLNQNPGKAER
jgi:hypothetical protein